MKTMVAAAAITLSMATVPGAEAGTLVVGGDTTPTFALGDPAFGGNAGNRTFYGNVLGAATRVVISSRSFGVPGFPSFANENLARFYGGFAGVSVAQTAGTIDTATLAGAGLLVLQFPDTLFSTAEKGAIRGFLLGGGSVLVVGEASIVSPIFPAPDPTPGSQSNVIVNDLLTGIGASIRVGNDTIGCCGDLVATGAQIGVDPLTAGVTSFKYGAATSVSGGRSLFFAPENFLPGAASRPFFAAETIAGTVPEPATWALMILGCGAVAGALRRRVATGVVAAA